MEISSLVTTGKREHTCTEPTSKLNCLQRLNEATSRIALFSATVL